MTLEIASEEYIMPIMVDVIEQFENDDLLVPVCENIKIESQNYAVPASDISPANNSTGFLVVSSENDKQPEIMKEGRKDKKSKYERKSVQCPECGTFVRNLKGVYNVNFN
jgi:hypothetical protein